MPDEAPPAAPAAAPATPPAASPPPPPAAPAAPAAAPAAVAPPAAPPAPVASAAPPPAELKLELPKDTKLTPEHLASTLQTAKELGLTQAQADKFLAVQDQAQRDFVSSVQKGFEERRKGWMQELRTDPVFGGQNATNEIIAQHMEQAKIGATHLFRPKDLAEMTAQGFGDAPWLILAAYNHYRALHASPALVNGRPVSEAPKPDDKSATAVASRLFPTSAPKAA